MSRVHGAWHSQQDFLDETLGRGAGDPDAFLRPEEIEPTKDGITNALYIIGKNKPKVERVIEETDPHSYAKWQGAKDYGILISDMADEPDEMSDHSDQQGYDL